MSKQPFEHVLEGDPPLLRQVEHLVVEAHRRWYTAHGHTDWSEPKAYHWLHYEDPNPVARLREGVERLPSNYDEDAITKLERRARSLGWRDQSK